MRAIQLVAQAARNVSDEVQAANPDIPGCEMIGMRNVVVHDYADVDLGLVWKTVREHLPGVIERLNAILAQSSTSQRLLVSQRAALGQRRGCQRRSIRTEPQGIGGC